MPRFRTALFIAFILISSSSFSQQNWPNTLLWRISGNGLTEPSYLYGTMHLQDKRLFQFTDSLYNSLEKVKGFALEVDFKELIDSMLTRTFRDAEEKFLDDEEVKIEKSKIDKTVDSIMKALDIKPGKMTRKDLKRIRDYRMNRLVQQGEMKTIVDGYLYGLAARMEKWVGGIEDVNDQLDLRDELGGELSTDQVFIPEANLRQGLEEMIRIYLRKDLQAIADYVNARYDDESVDKLLVQRNHKMARRMDSLTKFRTMFFAVGAAHLPGEEGVINLLRAKGFEVSPVLSDKTISPEHYAGKLTSLPWKKVENELYSIEMPGNPSDFNLYGDAVQMKVYFDLPTMTFYMSGHSAHTPNEVDLDKMFLEMAERMGVKGKKIKPKNFSSGGITGKEESFNSEDGAVKMRLLKKNNRVYLLFAVSSKMSNLDSRDINKYFSSFQAKDYVEPTAQWEQFTIPGKGFHIQLPGKAKPNKAIDAKANGSEWKFTTYDIVDNAKGFYYMMQVRDILPGYYLEGDSSYFQTYKEDISGNYEKIFNEEIFRFEGWPAYRLDVGTEDNLIFKILLVLRANRVYSILAGGSSDADFSDADKVFSSFTLEKYSPKPFAPISEKGFRTSAPEAFFMHPGDSTKSETGDEHYTSYDAAGALSFDVFKGIISPYYWVKNDSIYFDSQINDYKSYEDSVIKKELVYNGKLKAVDFILKREGSSTFRKVRMMVNKDTLYSLVAYIPGQYMANENISRFFTDFRITNEVDPVIYGNKARQLLDALRSQDSLTYSRAKEAMDLVEFTPENLPLLHDALLYSNPYAAIDDPGNDIIARELQLLGDSSTIRFIADNYHRLANERGHLKYTMLQVLAHKRTSESYQLLKQLITKHPPVNGDASVLSYPLRDSLKLTISLYPEILQLAGDPLFTDVLVEITDMMLDSSMIRTEDIHPFKDKLLSHGRKHLATLNENNEFIWSYGSWLSLLTHLGDSESLDLLKAFARQDYLPVKYEAVVRLLQKDQKPDEKMLEPLAASVSYRKYLYDELKKFNKLSLFPSAWATQLKIAESEIFGLATDDYEPSSVVFLGDKQVTFQGQKQKFFLFAINFEGEDYKEQYLGITGPYPLKGKEIISGGKASVIHWTEELELPRLQQQFSDLLEQMEAHLKEMEES